MAAKCTALALAMAMGLLVGCQRHAETGGGGGSPEEGQRTQGVATPSVGRTTPPYSGKPRTTPAPGHPAPTVPPNPKAKIPGVQEKRPATPLAPTASARGE